MVEKFRVLFSKLTLSLSLKAVKTDIDVVFLLLWISSGLSLSTVVLSILVHEMHDRKNMIEPNSQTTFMKHI